MSEQAFSAEPILVTDASPVEGARPQRNPFAAAGYRVWWLASVVAGLGVGVQTTTVPLFIKDRVGADHRELAIAAALICQQLPSAVFALLGGVIADRVERRRILVRTYAVAACVSLTYVALSGANARFIWPVFILSAVVGSAGAFTNPARQSMMPQILKSAQLQNGVIFGTMAFMASLQFVGPSLGGIIADTTSLTVAFGVEVAMLSFAAIFFSRIATDRPEPSGRHVFHDLADGLRYIRKSPSLMGVLLLGAVPGVFIMGPFAVTVVAMVKDVFHESDKFVGFLWGAFGGGIVLGSVGMSLVRPQRRGLLLCVAVFAGGGLTALYGASSTLLLSLALLVAAGAIGPAIFINFGVALLQENVDRNMMGRVMSMWGLVFTISSAVGYAFAGVMSNAFGPHVTLIAGGSVASALGLITVLTLRPVTRLG
jgi:MFS transporter, ENTS family, enterobactin (siderophore) exporter